MYVDRRAKMKASCTHQIKLGAYVSEAGEGPCKVRLTIYMGLLVIGCILFVGCRSPAVGGTPMSKPGFGSQIPDAEWSSVESLVQEITASSQGMQSQLKESLRIATYNIQNLTDGKDDGWQRTSLMTHRQIKNAAKIIDEINADILAIQEIENLAVLERLNRVLKKPYVHLYISRFNSSGRDKKLNIAVASRLPVREVVEIDFNAVTGVSHKPPRGAVRFMIELEKNRFLLGYAVHFKSNYGDDAQNILKRKVSAELLRSDVETVVRLNPEAAFEVILLGDVNVDPDLPKWSKDPSLSAFDDWVDLWRGIPLEVRTTLPKRLGDPELAFDPVCFDRIIVSPSLTRFPWKVELPIVKKAGVDIQNIYVRPGQSDMHVSDHYPVYVDIKK